MLCLWMCCLPVLCLAQSLNRFDAHGRKIGHWITYADSAKTIKLFEGRFRKDKPKGKSYFYTNSGILDRVERNRFRKLKTTFYYPNGNVRMTGNARLENLPDRIHYYYYGQWKAYNDSGKLVKYYEYQKGVLIKTTYLDKNMRINDSLIEALTAIDREFTSHNVALTDSINAHVKNPQVYRYFKKELARKDSLSFAKIDRILDAYGYPGKAIAGDATPIPFYILGFAPATLKEKHLPKLIMAATRSDIDWKSLAFFIDKLKLAKGEKQLYGTQYFLKNNEYILYPVEDEAHLKDRRSSVGLEND
ncbi:MAG: hypothetical protein O9353_15585 [Bacteroidia bacterium]|nr:hypothetical protein [Bacteroidia bacterium]